MSERSLLTRFSYLVRNLRSKALFDALETHARGDVLDVGGWHFYLFLKNRPVAHTTWTALENDPEKNLSVADPRFKMVHGDGCKMTFADGSFDTLVNIQVLEHVFDPMAMINESARVLKKGGMGVFLIPWTGNLHGVPHHYYNFSIYWVREAMKRAGLDIVELKPLGGAWSTIASRLFFYFIQAAGTHWAVYTRRRRFLFYALAPLMAVFAAISIPICMLFSLGDIQEEANNHLVVVRKPA